MRPPHNLSNNTTYGIFHVLVLAGLCVVLAGCANVPVADRDRTIHSVGRAVDAININTASAAELDTLPGVGLGTAMRIIEHRERFGPFRKPEHLMLLRGVSDARFREMRSRIVVE